MASLRDSVKDYQEELRDGIAWVAFWKQGRSWNAELFHLEVDGTLEPFDRSRLEEIKAADPAAVILNGYYCGHLGENMSLDELTAGVRHHYKNGTNDVAGFIEAHDDRLPPELIEEAKAAAHAAGLPFSEKPYRDGEDFAPYVFDGSMSIEDYELMHRMIEKERSEQMDEWKTGYSSYDHDRLEAADKMKIERGIYFDTKGADISPLTALPLAELVKLREESAAAEQTVFENLKVQASAWEEQAGKTLLFDKAIEYARIPEVKHTANKWQDEDNDRHTISNRVYKMSYHVYENTRYDKAAQKSIPYSYTLSWNIYTNSPHGYGQAKIAGQDRKVFADRAAMEKYLNGRIKAYEKLFTEISPAIPPEYAEQFRVNGQLLPGYTVEGEEIKQPAADIPAAAPRTEPGQETEQFAILIDSRTRFETGEPGGYWLSMPATKKELHKAMQSVGITTDNPQDFFIHGYSDREDRHIALPYDMVCAAQVDELNFLAARLETLDAAGIAALNAATQRKNGFENIGQLIDFTYNEDFFVHIPEVHNPRELGDYYLNKSGMVQMPAEWKNSIDPIAFGRNAAAQEKGSFTEYGYLVESGDAWEKHFEGRDVPEEYRIMSYPQPTVERDAAPAVQTAAIPEAQPQEQPEIPVPDTTISIKEMQDYGYSWDGMFPLKQEAAERLFTQYGIEVFRIYEDGTEGAVTSLTDLQEHAEKGGLFGVEKETWEALHEYNAMKQQLRESEPTKEALLLYGKEDSYGIYQLAHGDATRDLRFEPYDRLQATGHTVDRANYELIYTAPLTADITLNSIWEKFNIDHPKDFKGHSLSISDIVVLHQNGKNTAHYVDSIGFQKVPEFLQEKQPQLTPDEHLTGEQIRTPRGSFSLTSMSIEQMKEAGYGLHHTSDDGKYHIMGNGTRAFAVAAEQPEKANPLKHIEDTIEQNDNNFDGIINNTPQTPTVDALEQKAKAGEVISLVDLAEAIKTDRENGRCKKAAAKEKPSIRAQLKVDKERAGKKKPKKQKSQDLERS